MGLVLNVHKHNRKYLQLQGMQLAQSNNDNVVYLYILRFATDEVTLIL